MEKTGIIILSAGNSSRLGTPKQLLDFKGKSLLKRIVDEATKDSSNQVVVVLGENYELLAKEFLDSPSTLCVNENWQEGMSTSIQKGLSTLLKHHPEISQCILAVCDQPYVDADVFSELKNLKEQSGKGIVATAFDQTFGVPALISSKYFEELKNLSGSGGAKSLIMDHQDDLELFPFELAKYDVDTWEDYYALQHEFISVDLAKKIIDSHLPKAKIKTAVPIQNAVGYTLGSDVFSKWDIPNFDQSSMDGYAIRYADCDQVLNVVSIIPAGNKNQQSIKEGEAMRIFTGAPFPIGADTIVMQEHVEVIDHHKIILKDLTIQLGQHVRKAGSEVSKHSLAMAAETNLSAAAIGYLAGIGISEIEIYKAAKVSLILTGNELQSVGKPLAFGQVYESNSFQLKAALKQIGIQDIEVFQVKDDLDELKKAMDQALATSDVLLLVGGVSVGDFDYVIKAADESGITQHFHRIRQKPGKPIYFGTKNEKLVFGLPGNPSSALTCFYLYVAPALEKMMNKPNQNKFIKAKMVIDYSKKPGLTHFLKAQYDGEFAMPLHAQESYRLQSYAQANCLLVLPEEMECVKAGDEIEIYLLDNK